MATLSADLAVLKAKAGAAVTYVRAHYKQLAVAALLGKYGSLLVALVLKVL